MPKETPTIRTATFSKMVKKDDKTFEPKFVANLAPTVNTPKQGDPYCSIYFKCGDTKEYFTLKKMKEIAHDILDMVNQCENIEAVYGIEYLKKGVDAIYEKKDNNKEQVVDLPDGKKGRIINGKVVPIEDDTPIEVL